MKYFLIMSLLFIALFTTQAMAPETATTINQNMYQKVQHLITSHASFTIISTTVFTGLFAYLSWPPFEKQSIIPFIALLSHIGLGLTNFAWLGVTGNKVLKIPNQQSV